MQRLACFPLLLLALTSCTSGEGEPSAAARNGLSGPSTSAAAGTRVGAGGTAPGEGSFGADRSVTQPENSSSASGTPEAASPRPSALEPSAGTPGGDADASAGPVVAPAEPPQDEAPQAFLPCPADGSPCAVLPLGDSITFGEGSSGGGYRVDLFRRAVIAGQRLTFVGTAAPNGPASVEGVPFPRAHQGHQGFVIDEGGFSATASLSLVLDGALPVLEPQIILLMIGTNDVNGNNNLAQAPERLSRLLDKIVTSEPNALLVVAQLTPTRDPVLNARIEAYNAAIVPEIGRRAASGQHVALVDLFTPFVETPDYENALFFDRLHPNDAGYALMASVWYEAIEALLPNSGASPSP
jgi:lysophospholipase L1-like esterase